MQAQAITRENKKMKYEEAVALLRLYKPKKIDSAFWYKQWIYGLGKKEKLSETEEICLQLPFGPEKVFGAKWRGWREYLGVQGGPEPGYFELHKLVKLEKFSKFNDYYQWAYKNNQVVKPYFEYKYDWESALNFLTGEHLKLGSASREMKYLMIEREMLHKGKIKTPQYAAFWVKYALSIWR